MFIASRHKRHCESRENKLTTNIRKHTNSRRTFAAGVFVSTRAPVPGYAHQNSKTGNSIHNIINCGFPCIIYFCPEIPICKSMDRRRFLKTAGLLAGGSMISGTQAINILKHQNKKMKITVLTGSPRKNGNTNHLASQFIKGAEEAGHKVYRFDCAGHQISPCRACGACGMNGDCVLKDDFHEVRRHIIESDIIVFSTPLYYFGFSAQLKTLIDRFYSINGSIKGTSKQVVLLMACGGPDTKYAEPMQAHYHMLLDYMGWKERGSVLALGMLQAGAVKTSPFSQQAYELGRSL